MYNKTKVDAKLETVRDSRTTDVPMGFLSRFIRFPLFEKKREKREREKERKEYRVRNEMEK